jgi:hypothetical protein
MLGAMRRRLVALGAALAVFALAACKDDPNIDGSQVAPVSSDCPSVCQRLVALCGYEPLGDECTDDAGAGYCDTQIDPDYLDCFATAPSCEDAWNCFTTVVPADDAGTD